MLYKSKNIALNITYLKRAKDVLIKELIGTFYWRELDLNVHI